MNASPLILALAFGITSAQAFPGAQASHPGAHRFGHYGLGRYGGAALLPDPTPPSVEPPGPPIVDLPYFETPAYAPAYPQPYFIPAARPRRSGPRIIYIGDPPKRNGPRVIYGTE